MTHIGKINEFIELLNNPLRERFPILCVSGTRYTGKRTMVQNEFKQRRIRLNTISYLNGNLKQYIQRLLYDRHSNTNILSMFEQKPTPVILCIPFFDRFVQHEKPASRVLFDYLSNETPKSCMPMIFIVNEPFLYHKYDCIKYISIHIRMNGIEKKDMSSQITYKDEVEQYCRGNFKRYNRIMREMKKGKRLSLDEFNKHSFIEEEERITMQQRMKLFFELLNDNETIPEIINEWTHSLQETEITTMLQTIHENILNHTKQTQNAYFDFLKTFLYTNELQIFQQLYNRHAIEPYWSYASIVIPFKSNQSIHSSSTIQFTRMLTRSSIYSNYRQFIQSIERKTHHPVQYFLDEYSQCQPERIERKTLNKIQNQYIKKWCDKGLNVGEARRLIRTFERIRKGGI